MRLIFKHQLKTKKERKLYNETYTRLMNLFSQDYEDKEDFYNDKRKSEAAHTATIFYVLSILDEVKFDYDESFGTIHLYFEFNTKKLSSDIVHESW